MYPVSNRGQYYFTWRCGLGLTIIGPGGERIGIGVYYTYPARLGPDTLLSGKHDCR